MNIQIKRKEDKEFTNANVVHVNFTKIINALHAWVAERGKSPWIVAIIETLPDEKSHMLLVDSLASQAVDQPSTMVSIVGVEITELLLDRKLVIK